MPVETQRDTYEEMLQALLRLSPDEVERRDTGELNLLCAQGLPGSEDLDIPTYLNILNEWTRIVRERTRRAVPDFLKNPSAWGCTPDYPLSQFVMSYMVTILKLDLGCHYDRRYGDIERLHEIEPPPVHDAKCKFINGLLSDKRYGSCASIPVLLVAIGRRLGYPLFLSCTDHHCWARWESADGQRFNIEASNPAGMVVVEDADYVKSAPPHPAIHTNFYTKSLSRVEELAQFFVLRAAVLEHHHRYREALPFVARACFIASQIPSASLLGLHICHSLLFLLKNGEPPPSHFDPAKEAVPRDHWRYDPRDYLPPEEVAMMLNIRGHYHEFKGETGNALRFYQTAIEQDPDNPDYAADLNRYNDCLAERSAKSNEKIQVGVASRSKPVATPRTKANGNGTLHAKQGNAGAVKSPAEAKKDHVDGVAAVYHARGCGLEQEGKFAEAEVLFAHAHSMMLEPAVYLPDLARVIRKEILADRMPPVVPPFPKKRKRSDGFPDYDPRLKLSNGLQAVIWWLRGGVLEHLQRRAQALTAYKRAVELCPEHPQYPKDVERMSRPVWHFTISRVSTRPAARPVMSVAREQVMSNLGSTWGDAFALSKFMMDDWRTYKVSEPKKKE